MVDASTVKLNRSAVSKRYNQELDNYKAQAKAFGTTIAGIAQSYGTDEGGLKEMVANYGEEAVAQMVQNYKVMKFLGDNAVAKSVDETQAAAEETTQAQTESKAQ